MRTQRKATAKRNTPPTREARPAINYKFLNTEHHALVTNAALQAGLSVNAWIVTVTLQAARKQLSEV